MDPKCLKCGTAHPSTARFCQECGATLGAPTEEGRTVLVDAALLPQRTDNGLADDSVPPKSGSAEAARPVSDYQPLNTQRELTVFAGDISTSMDEPYNNRLTKLQAAKRAARSMVVNKARLDPEDEVGLVAFCHQAYPLQQLHPLTSHKQQIIQAIEELAIEGGTDINQGLKAARDMFDWSREGVVRRIILLTDGHGGHPLGTADDLKERGVIIDVTGIGDHPADVNEKLLRRVASTIDGEVHYRFIKDAQTLVDHITRLGNKSVVVA